MVHPSIATAQVIAMAPLDTLPAVEMAKWDPGPDQGLCSFSPPLVPKSSREKELHNISQQAIIRMYVIPVPLGPHKLIYWIPVCSLLGLPM